MAIRLVLRRTLQFYALFSAAWSRRGHTFPLSTVKLTKKAADAQKKFTFIRNYGIFLGVFESLQRKVEYRDNMLRQSPRPTSAVCSVIYFLASTIVAKKKEQKKKNCLEGLPESVAL